MKRDEDLFLFAMVAVPAVAALLLFGAVFAVPGAFLKLIYILAAVGCGTIAYGLHKENTR